MKFHFGPIFRGRTFLVSGSGSKTPSQRTIETIVPLEFVDETNSLPKLHGLWTQSRVYLFDGYIVSTSPKDRVVFRPLPNGHRPLGRD